MLEFLLSNLGAFYFLFSLYSRTSSAMWEVSDKSSIAALFLDSRRTQSSADAYSVSPARFENALSNRGSSLPFFVCFKFLIMNEY